MFQYKEISSFTLLVATLIKFTQNDLEYACEKKSFEMIYYIHAKGIPFNIVCLRSICKTHCDSLVKKAINDKIFPDDICLQNAITTGKLDTIEILLGMGCIINDDALDKFVSSNFILRHDLSQFGIEYNQKLYDLCVKHKTNVSTILNKFTFDTQLIELHLLCKTDKWNKIYDYIVKNELGFDQTCVNNACENKKDHTVLDFIMYYDHSRECDKNSTDKQKQIYESIKNKSKFCVTFRMLKTAYNNNVQCDSIINILEKQYDNNDEEKLS